MGFLLRIDDSLLVLTLNVTTMLLALTNCVRVSHVRHSVCAGRNRQSTNADGATTTKVTRRQAASCVLALLANGMQPAQARDSGDWSTPGLAEEEDPTMPKFIKLGSGVIVQNLIAGTGDREARAGDTVLLDYVLRRANGYFIYSTIDSVSFQPADVPTGAVKIKLDESTLPGLVEAIQGMKKGGRRRVLVPPEVGYLAGSGLQPAMPTFATGRQLENHKREPLVFEIEIVNIQ